MFSLQKFLGKDPRFFDMFEESVSIAANCASALTTLLADPSQTANLHLVRQARQNSKHITEKIQRLAVRTFVTVLEREDIEALASAIYKIPKPLEKFAERYLMAIDVFGTRRTFHQVELIQEATKTLGEMIRHLQGMNLEKVQRLNTKIQSAESEADELEINLLRDLYKTTSNPVEVVVVRDLFDLLEKGVDRCRDAGNVVVHIAHKNS